MNSAMDLDCRTPMSKFHYAWIMVETKYYSRTSHVSSALVRHRNFFNFPTGECMDYTFFPRSNLSPGDSNFQILTDIYGTSPSSEASAAEGDATTEEAVTVVETPPNTVLEQYSKAVTSLPDMECIDCTVDLGDGYWLVVHQLLTPS